VTTQNVWKVRILDGYHSLRTLVIIINAMIGQL